MFSEGIATTEIPETIPVSSTTDWQAAFGFTPSSSSTTNHTELNSSADLHDDDLDLGEATQPQGAGAGTRQPQPHPASYQQPPPPHPLGPHPAGPNQTHPQAGLQQQPPATHPQPQPHPQLAAGPPQQQQPQPHLTHHQPHPHNYYGNCQATNHATHPTNPTGHEDELGEAKQPHVSAILVVDLMLCLSLDAPPPLPSLLCPSLSFSLSHSLPQ